MKFINTVIPILLLVFTTLTSVSCNYILENNKVKNEIKSKIETRISLNKKEAKLLLIASRNNLDILKLCEAIKHIDTQNSVSQLTERLEKTHFEISKNYNELAEDKLISIPNYISTNHKIEIKNIGNEEFIEKNLNLILTKIDTQTQLLDTLSKTTDNVEFKVLAVKESYKLKSNIDKIEITLNRLYQ